MPMPASQRSATLPPDGAEAVRRIIDMAEEAKPRLQPLTAAEFLALDLPPRALILDPWLPTQGLAMMHSARGIGKTHLALGIAYAVANGGRLLGWSAPSPRRVLYLDGEMPAAAMQRRLAAIVAGFNGEPPAPEYLRLLSADIIEGGLPDLGTKEGQAEVDTAICEAELIILDNISTLVRSGKENEAEAGSRFRDGRWVTAARGVACCSSTMPGRADCNAARRAAKTCSTP
jgi:RecA-family ATPase